MLKGDKMRMLRLYKKIRQQDVADAIGISRNYLSMMENEKKLSMKKYSESG
jgi:transcriptional regulator with XRE-family HTH domain